MRFAKFVIPLLVIASSSIAKADLISAFAQQANTVAENNVGGTLRAVYLGSLSLSDFKVLPSFAAFDPTGKTSFSSIRGGVNIISATNVEVFLGSGSTSFFSNPSDFYSTNLSFSNTPGSSDVEGRFSPGLGPNDFFDLPDASKAGIFNQLVNNGSLDVWLVGDNAGVPDFNAPSSSTTGGSTQILNFQIQLNAVPEPSSLALLTIPVGLLMARRRRVV
jgi:hypothetical protein